MRALVTGAAGFIGSTLVDRLLADGHEVVGVDDLSTGRLANLRQARESNRERPGGFHFHQVDVTAAPLAELLGRLRPEVVYHLAAQADVRVSVADPIADARTNVLGTINVLTAAVAGGARKVVLASSGGSIYGEPRTLPVSERRGLDPRSPYAAAKVAAEYYLGCWRSLYGIQGTTLALANVYGPRQDPDGEAGVVAIFAGALLRGAPTRIYGDGTASRDYVFVDDVVEAFVRFSGDVADGRRLNIGTGVATTVRDLHREIAAATGGPDTPAFAPERAGELHAIAIDPGAARAFGWLPTTSLASGLALTVAWIRQVMADAGYAPRR